MQVAVQLERSSRPGRHVLPERHRLTDDVDIYPSPAQVRGSGEPVRPGTDYGDVGVNHGSPTRRILSMASGPVVSDIRIEPESAAGVLYRAR